MNKNIIFWGAKFKAGIIYDLIHQNKILENTKNLRVKYLFDPNLEKASNINIARAYRPYGRQRKGWNLIG